MILYNLSKCIIDKGYGMSKVIKELSGRNALSHIQKSLEALDRICYSTAWIF